MEGSSSKPTPSSSRYVSWDEVAVYGDGGSRAFHYYLKKSDGTADLAVVGKKKRPYRCVMPRRWMTGLGDSESVAKRLESREDVIDWLHSVISDPQPQDQHVDCRRRSNLNASSCAPLKLGNSSEGFMWLGSSWTCTKMRRHYPRFQKCGVKISVHNFVYVLSEDNKRLVAYIDDMYEDSEGNKMVVVQWFHKVDEVGLVLSRSYNDKEIFYSRSVQDLSVECIDGIATVLGPRHFEKYMKELEGNRKEAFVCQELFDDNKTSTFDITRVEGYWNQPLVKHTFPSLPPKPPLKPCIVEPSKENKQNADQDPIGIRPNKRQRLLQPNTVEEPCNLGEDSAGALSKKLIKDTSAVLLPVGSAVEVLCQDSGIRGCWFTAVIIKVYKDKVKVRYLDLEDADDEGKKPEEWISASKVAASDKLGLRSDGRRTIRPLVRSNEDRFLHGISVGTVVDARWQDGWWEGIVVRKESDVRFHVFFPGEKLESAFPLKDLRPSQEWIGNQWILLKERPDIVTSVVHLLQEEKHDGEASSGNQVALENLHGNAEAVIVNKPQPVKDISKDIYLANLKWKSLGKRSYRTRKRLLKEHHESKKASLQDIETRLLDELFVRQPSFKVDREKCKLIGASLYNRSVVPPLTNLVMSR